MTVTHRKTVESAAQVAPVPVTEPGVSYECDGCDSDITHTIRIKCAAKGCEEIDLCVSCFSSGKEVGEHKPWHDYRVVEQHPYPIFTEDWGADEELLLIEGLLANGLGNWTAAAEHVGTRTPEEAEAHYNEVYLNSPNFPLPIMDKTFTTSPQDFHARKRTRISSMRQAALQLANSISKPSVILTSAPTNHEIQGYMSGRLDFEHELENDAEESIKDMEFGLVYEWGGDKQPDPGPPPIQELDPREKEELAEKEKEKNKGEGGGEDADSNDTAVDGYVPDPVETADSTRLKLAMLDIYYGKLDKRQEAKSFVFDRGMLDFKKWQAAEKKRQKEDRELINKHKPFAKIQTAEDFERFINGVMQENALRARIKDLQEYRRQGITSLGDAEKWTVASATRLYSRPTNGYSNHKQRASVPPGFDFDPSFGMDVGSLPDDPLRKPRRPAAPLNLSNASSLHLLTPSEQILCSQLRILPKPYLVIKETLISEFAKRNGALKKKDAREMMPKVDGAKVGRIWDYLEEVGLLGGKKLSGGDSMVLDSSIAAPS